MPFDGAQELIIRIDFETGSELDVKTVGSWRYAKHHSTHIKVMSWAIGDMLPTRWMPGQPPPYWVSDQYWAKGYRIECHGAHFEQAIWAEIAVKQHGWAPVAIENWQCTAAMGATHALPRSLEDAGLVMALPIQKDMEGRKAMLKLCKPRRARKGEPRDEVHWWTKEEVPDDFQTLYRYCDTDVVTQRFYSRALKPMQPAERKVWELDQRINQRGFMVDLHAVRCALDLVSQYETKLNAEVFEITAGWLSGVTQVAAVVRWINMQGVPCYSFDKVEVARLLKLPDLPADVRRIVEIRQSLGKTSVRKLLAMVACACPDGRIRDMLLYHGASTGRWTGARVQLQNLPRGGDVKDPITAIEIIRTKDLALVEAFYGDPMHFISSCIRPMLVACAHHDLIVADYNAIESRVLNWLAGVERTLDIFRAGGDVYRAAAADIYGIPEDQVSEEQRQVGKVAILALGYQGGVVAFQKMAANYRVAISDEMADRVKTAWREANPEIVQLWRDIEDAAIEAVRTRKLVKVGKHIAFGVTGGFLYCRLPSGRCLAYKNPRLKRVMTPWGQEKSQLVFDGLNDKKIWTQEDTYGGKLVENIVQAIARDLMVAGMLRVEAAGYAILLTVHDEVIAEVRQGFGDLAEYEKMLAEVEPWAEGLPVKAKGWRGPRYRK